MKPSFRANDAWSLDEVERARVARERSLDEPQDLLSTLPFDQKLDRNLWEPELAHRATNEKLESWLTSASLDTRTLEGELRPFSAQPTTSPPPPFISDTAPSPSHVWRSSHGRGRRMLLPTGTRSLLSRRERGTSVQLVSLPFLLLSLTSRLTQSQNLSHDAADLVACRDSWRAFGIEDLPLTEPLSASFPPCAQTLRSSSSDSRHGSPS